MGVRGTFVDKTNSNARIHKKAKCRAAKDGQGQGDRGVYSVWVLKQVGILLQRKKELPLRSQK